MCVIQHRLCIKSFCSTTIDHSGAALCAYRIFNRDYIAKYFNLILSKCTDKKKNKIFLIYKEIQMGSGAKSFLFYQCASEKYMYTTEY
jgi:hypothetical protein